MSQTPNPESDRDAFTCGTLLMCLYLPGLSKKKPAEETGKSRRSTKEQDQRPTEQEPPQIMSSRAVALEKLECSSLYSGSNIVFDFLVEEPEEGDDRAGDRVVQGYCPSPCFDLPVELIRADERCSVVASDTPVTSAFVFDGYHGGALKKMASCLASGVAAGSEERPPHLMRFLSASARPPVMSSFGPPKGSAADGDREFTGLARDVIQRGGLDGPGREAVV